jgi:hypothetical protein
MPCSTRRDYTKVSIQNATTGSLNGMVVPNDDVTLPSTLNFSTKRLLNDVNVLCFPVGLKVKTTVRARRPYVALTWNMTPIVISL